MATGSERDPAKRLKTRLALRGLGRCTNNRKIEGYLSATEAAEPDHIEFWGIEPSHATLDDDAADVRTAEPTAKRARQQDLAADLGGDVCGITFSLRNRE